MGNNPGSFQKHCPPVLIVIAMINGVKGCITVKKDQNRALIGNFKPDGHFSKTCYQRETVQVASEQVSP